MSMPGATVMNITCKPEQPSTCVQVSASGYYPVYEYMFHVRVSLSVVKVAEAMHGTYC